MVEQTYTLHYLGCSVLSKGTTGLGAIQKPLKELYFSFRKKQTKTPIEVYMQITREGLNMLTPDGNAQGHQLKTTLHKFSQVSYVEAVQFTSKVNNNRKTVFAFMPLDKKRAVASSEKLFSTLEKKNNYLHTANHQPIVVCLMRRQVGVKALDCHVFISLSPIDATKIVDSYTEMQQQSSQKEYKGDFRPLPQKPSAAPPGNQWDGAYRSDYGPYTDRSYPAPGMSDPNYPHDGRYQLRDEHFRGHSAQDRSAKPNEPPIAPSYGGMQYHPHPHQMMAGEVAGRGGPMHNYSPRGYGEIQERGRPISSYFGQTPSLQQPQAQSSSSPLSSQKPQVNHSRGNSYEDRVRDYPPDTRYNYQRYEPPPTSQSHDDQLWNASRVPPYERQVNNHGRPLSLAHTPQGGYTPVGNNNIAPMGRADPRQALSTTDLPSQMSRNSANVGRYNQIPEGNKFQRREPRSASPTHMGPTFSASNLESRQQQGESSSPGGLSDGPRKPVAKVPPHKIAGVKVLPSSFELPKRPTSPKPMYKSNEDELFWEKQKVQFRNHASNNNNPTNRYSSHFPANNNYAEYQNHPQGGLGLINTQPPNYSNRNSDFYRNGSGPPLNQSDIYSHYNNRYEQDYVHKNGTPPVSDRRYHAGTDYGGPATAERRPPAYFDVTGGDSGGSSQSKSSEGNRNKPETKDEDGNNMMRKKEAEIANMFQHMEIQSGNRRLNRYPSQTDLNFEQSLGYYP